MGISKCLQIHEQKPVQSVWFLAENGPYFRPSRWLLNIIDFRTRQTFCCLNLNLKKMLISVKCCRLTRIREFHDSIWSGAAPLCCGQRGLKDKTIASKYYGDMNPPKFLLLNQVTTPLSTTNDIFWVKEKWITRCSTSLFSQGVIG